MKALTEKLVHYGVLVVLTIVSGWVMWKLSARGQEQAAAGKLPIRPLAASATPKALVTVLPLTPRMCEVTETFAGAVRPWERFSVGFEVGGRVLTLGTDAGGAPLDEGDRVEAGQALAVLDDRVLRAQRAEAMARIELATTELERLQDARRRNPGAVSETVLQTAVTDRTLAEAQLEMATKNLEDATLRSPVAATISRRLINPGESVSPNQIVFELLQNEEMLLVVSVPESRVRELQQRQLAVERNRRAAALTAASATGRAADARNEDAVFRAHVRLEGRDQFGRPWPQIDGEVYRIAEASDPQTTLFAVEVRLPNEDRLLRPGMVGTARIVVDRIQGYEIPSSAILYRQNRAFVFAVESQNAPLEMLYWSLGTTPVHFARRVELPHWSDQGSVVVAPTESTSLSNVITRGQFRLSDGQAVRIANELPPLEEGVAESSVEVRSTQAAGGRTL
ncbi:MAG: efflux RND transporter periplasmic adaptor subunit [Pirellulales bacterium]|nr:efflux RND transporter periplasmic adaptor subunit [Pirellulales bacterium]